MVVAAAKPDVNTDMTFLHEDNLCGSTLLNLVSSGHSILVDIRILSERVPTAFFAAASLDKDRGDVRSGSKREGSKRASSTSDGLFLNIFGHSSSSNGAAVDQSTASDDVNNSGSNNDMQESKKYAPFLFDFSYLNNPEEFEQSLALSRRNEPSAENLLELEREFAINHRQSIEEYYDLFYSIYKYQKELNQFVDELSKGYYIQYTIESVLLDKDGRQLLCEGVWLFGVILIHMESLLPVSKEGEVDSGDVLHHSVSYYRMHPANSLHLFLHVNIIFTGLYSRTTYHCILPFVWEGWGYVSL